MYPRGQWTDTFDDKNIVKFQITEALDDKWRSSPTPRTDFALPYGRQRMTPRYMHMISEVQKIMTTDLRNIVLSYIGAEVDIEVPTRRLIPKEIKGRMILHLSTEVALLIFMIRWFYDPDFRFEVSPFQTLKWTVFSNRSRDTQFYHRAYAHDKYLQKRLTHTGGMMIINHILSFMLGWNTISDMMKYSHVHQIQDDNRDKQIAIDRMSIINYNRPTTRDRSMLAMFADSDHFWRNAYTDTHKTIPATLFQVGPMLEWHQEMCWCENAVKPACELCRQDENEKKTSMQPKTSVDLLVRVTRRQWSDVPCLTRGNQWNKYREQRSNYFFQRNQPKHRIV